MPIIEIDGYECAVCGHVWYSRKKKPLRCAKCRSPYWDKPKPVERNAEGNVLDKAIHSHMKGAVLKQVMKESGFDRPKLVACDHGFPKGLCKKGCRW